MRTEMEAKLMFYLKLQFFPFSFFLSSFFYSTTILSSLISCSPKHHKSCFLSGEDECGQRAGPTLGCEPVYGQESETVSSKAAYAFPVHIPHN